MRKVFGPISQDTASKRMGTQVIEYVGLENLIGPILRVPIGAGVDDIS